jgi:hypothetical protein
MNDIDYDKCFSCNKEFRIDEWTKGVQLREGDSVEWLGFYCENCNDKQWNFKSKKELEEYKNEKNS